MLHHDVPWCKFLHHGDSTSRCIMWCTSSKYKNIQLSRNKKFQKMPSSFHRRTFLRSCGCFATENYTNNNASTPYFEWVIPSYGSPFSYPTNTTQCYCCVRRCIHQRNYSHQRNTLIFKGNLRVMESERVSITFLW